MNTLKESVYLKESILLRKKTHEKKSDRIPLAITYKRFLPNSTKTIRKNWNILRINEIFKNEPITRDLNKTKTSNKLLGHIRQNRRAKKDLKTLKEGKC